MTLKIVPYILFFTLIFNVILRLKKRLREKSRRNYAYPSGSKKKLWWLRGSHTVSTQLKRRIRNAAHRRPRRCFISRRILDIGAAKGEWKTNQVGENKILAFGVDFFFGKCGFITNRNQWGYLLGSIWWMWMCLKMGYKLEITIKYDHQPLDFRAF